MNWISHRGFKANAVENTHAAFEAAVDLGFSTLETDLRLTRDGHIVLHHDPDLRRLAGVPTVIAQSTRSELEKISLAGGSRLLFLDEFTRAFSRCSWVFDIKPETGMETLTHLIGWVKEQNLTHILTAKTRFVLWNEAHQHHLERLLPDAASYARSTECWRAGLSAIAGVSTFSGIKSGRTYALPPRLKLFELYTSAKIEHFHRLGARVLAFLPESERDVRQALACGVDDILTNGRIVE